MGAWLLYAEGEDTRSVTDDLFPVARWLADHHNLYCVRHEGDAFKYDYLPLPDTNDEGERQLPRAVFLQRERDEKFYRVHPQVIEWVTLDPEDEESEIAQITVHSIRGVLVRIELEYGTHARPWEVRRPPRPAL